jgi:hypothetical protein
MNPFGGSRSFSRPKRLPSGARPVLGVGWRVLVIRGEFPAGPIALTDPAGNAVGSVVDGDEVEILAWRPGRSVDPHYRVRSSAGTEGWIEAANLARKSVPVPVVPPQPIVVASAPVRRSVRR